MNYNNFSSRLSHREKKKSHNATYQKSKAEVLVQNMFRNKKDCRKHKQKIRKRMEWNGHMPPQQLHALQYTSHYSEMQFSLWEKKKIKIKMGGKLALLVTLRENCPPSAMTKKKLESPPLQAEHPGSLRLSSQERSCSPFSIHVVLWWHLHTLSRSLLHSRPRTDPRTPAVALPCWAEGQDCSLGLLWPLPGQPRMLVAFLVPRERCWLVFNSVSSRT